MGARKSLKGILRKNCDEVEFLAVSNGKISDPCFRHLLTAFNCDFKLRLSRKYKSYLSLGWGI